MSLHLADFVPARKIPRSIHEDARDVARALAGTDPFEQSCRDRKRVEMLFAGSRSLRPLRTYDVLPSSSPGRRHSQWRALRKRRLRPVPMRRKTSDRAMV